MTPVHPVTAVPLTRARPRGEKDLAPAQEIRPIQSVRILLAGPQPGERTGQAANIGAAEGEGIHENHAGMVFLVLGKLAQEIWNGRGDRLQLTRC